MKKNKPLTITDKNMTRFMMTMNEALELVLFALANGNNGEIFIKKAPACDIQTLAKALIDIFNANNKIDIIGPRHGEKLYESLLSREEMSRASVDGEAYDTEKFGQYYRAYGVKAPATSTPAPTPTPAVAEPVTETVAPVVAPEPVAVETAPVTPTTEAAPETGSKAEDILAMIRARQQKS